MITYKGLPTLEALEGAKKYNKWIAEQFLPNLTYPLLEIGSGTGNMSLLFMRKDRITLSDIDHGLVSHLKKRFKNEKNISVKKIDIAKKIVRTEKNAYRSVVAVNVLEHIKDDENALLHMHSMLKKNGILMLLVPAKMKAYTQLDKKLGHFRRYEKEELKKKIQKAGFKIQKLYFFNFLGLLSWMVRDRVERGYHIRPYQAALFDFIVPVLKMIETKFKPFVGISLIVIAKKV